jgi:NAD(P)-dependent dehydrogenase (short-subunit alcohol dehydrogenase family)
MNMDLNLAGRHALITGGSRGIGRATAEVLAAEGVNVTLVARDPAVLEEEAAAIRARHQVQVRAIPADLSIEAEVLRVAAGAGVVDILVNNAGAIPPGTLTGVDNETWRKAWDLKVFGFISLCRAVYPAMAARRSGVIINVIGAAGEKFPPGYIAGATANAGLMAFTRALGKAARGRRCCCATRRSRRWAIPTAGWNCARPCRSAGRARRRRSPARWRSWPARARATPRARS